MHGLRWHRPAIVADTGWHALAVKALPKLEMRWWTAALLALFREVRYRGYRFGSDRGSPTLASAVASTID
jgi:hypothetical protein